MSVVCNFCNKTFSSQTNLSVHQKTAKYCLNIQNTLKPTEGHSPIIEYKCTYCDKVLTTNTNLKAHLSSCKSKQEHDKMEIQRAYYEKELEKLHIHYTEEINKLTYEKDKQNELLQQENKMLKEYLAERKHELEEHKSDLIHIVDKLSSNSHVVINDNSTHTNTYHIQFNKLLESLLPYTEDNILKQFGQISILSIMSDTDKMEDMFISQFSKRMSPLAFCTDPSRGKVVTKDEEGKPVKRLAQEVVLECLSTCKKSINNMLNDIHYRIGQSMDEQLINTEEFQRSSLQHAYLHDYLKLHNNTVTPYIRKLSNSFSRGCPQLAVDK